jgi:putative oxidoreductase
VGTLDPVNRRSWREVLVDWSDVPLRAILAATFLTHGYEKLFVNGVDKFAGFLTMLHVPAPNLMAWVAVMAEFGGAVLMILGLATRLAAAGHMGVMTVAILSVHLSQGFQMKVVDGRMAGFEWQVALFCVALCLLLRGAGPLSLDRLIYNRYFLARSARASSTQPAALASESKALASSPSPSEVRPSAIRNTPSSA